MMMAKKYYVHWESYRSKKFDILRGAEGFIQASKEDFGISSVEAQACGIPVIAFGEGGALETVIDAQSNGNPTGIFFRNNLKMK